MMPAQEAENGVDRLRLSDQRENFHLPAAMLADQRVFRCDGAVEGENWAARKFGRRAFALGTDELAPLISLAGRNALAGSRAGSAVGRMPGRMGR
jgi:hypothetical protein